MLQASGWVAPFICSSFVFARFFWPVLRCRLLCCFWTYGLHRHGRWCLVKPSPRHPACPIICNNAHEILQRLGNQDEEPSWCGFNFDLNRLFYWRQLGRSPHRGEVTRVSVYHCPLSPIIRCVDSIAGK